MRRRDFITLLGGAVAWPLAAWGQQSAMPVVGFMHILSPEREGADYAAKFRQGLKGTGFIEGQNVAVEYRWLEGRFDRIPAFVVWDSAHW